MVVLPVNWAKTGTAHPEKRTVFLAVHLPRLNQHQTGIHTPLQKTTKQPIKTLTKFINSQIYKQTTISMEKEA